MKNGQWVNEWKALLKPFDTYTKKNDPGMVFKRVWETESSKIEKTLKPCDAKFKAYFDVEDDKRRDAMKAFATAVDSFEKAQKGMCSSIKKVAGRSKDKNLPKIVGNLTGGVEKIQDSCDTVIFGMDMEIKHQLRQKKKSGSVAKDLAKACTDAKAWAKKLGKEPELEAYASDINDYASDIGDELNEMLKLAKKDKAMSRDFRPDSNAIRMMKFFSKKDATFKGHDDVEPWQIRGAVDQFVDNVDSIVKWNQKTWLKKANSK